MLAGVPNREDGFFSGWTEEFTKPCVSTPNRDDEEPFFGRTDVLVELIDVTAGAVTDTTGVRDVVELSAERTGAGNENSGFCVP
jgi:hypothetical protein